MYKKKKILARVIVGMSIFFLPTLTLLSHRIELKVEAAVITSGALEPGENSDTGNHELDSGFQQNANNWNILAGDSKWWKWDASGNNYLWLANSVKNSWVYQSIRATLDFSKPLTIKTPYWYDKADVWKMGDASGFFLTPANNDMIKQNAPNATGQKLGIAGLKDSFFIGRDIWYNGTFDGPSGTNKGQDKIEIRKTDANGAIEQSSSTTVPWVQISAPLQFQGSGSTRWSSETQTMTWSNIVDNKNGTYTGTLSLTAAPDSGYNNNGAYKPQTISRTITLKKNMSFGSLAITGNNTGVIQGANASKNASFSATRGTVTFPVNFIDKTTNQPIKGVTAAKITANTGDTIGVTNSLANASDDYTFVVPRIKGYNFSSSTSIKVANYDEYNEANPNAINVYYSPIAETADFKTYYTEKTPGTGIVTDAITGLTGGDPSSTMIVTEGVAATLPVPNPALITGDFGHSITNIPSLTVPVGYKVDHIVGPDGKNGQTYPDLASAIVANPTFDDLSNNKWANHFSIYLTAEPASASFSYNYVDSTRAVAPSLPDIPSEIGVTGGVIKDPSEQLPELPAGVTIKDVTPPDGNTYGSLSEALAVDANKYYQAGTVAFTLNVTAPPAMPTLDEVPTVEFGTQTLKSGTHSYGSETQTGLKVTDESYTNKGWHVTASMSQQFTSDTMADLETAPFGTFLKGASISFHAGTLNTSPENTAKAPQALDFTLQEDGAAVSVMDAATGTGQGAWELSYEDVRLQVDGNKIAVGKPYQATINWSLSDVPAN
ncbi:MULTISPECIES: WxL domain-containing protein [Enterococcus]|uniref:WxL domain-containing protein n=1 Tax=Enterococcus TaxID=1350 RepID=UPI00189C3E7C|nr:WxL domain-containing protein [Enterococcus mundtii]MBO1086194.1 WxL domain-containing protein [Enterococcus mundtii]MDV7744381.1 WxL domain-containing protein [Enterococcus mundtii]